MAANTTSPFSCPFGIRIQTPWSCGCSTLTDTQHEHSQGGPKIMVLSIPVLLGTGGFLAGGMQESKPNPHRVLGPLAAPNSGTRMYSCLQAAFQ